MSFEDIAYADVYPDDDHELDLKEAFDLPDELPPLILPPVATLAQTARQAPVLAQLTRLADWLGAGGRDIDEDMELAPADKRAAAAAAGVDAATFPYVWDIALSSDFVVAQGGRDTAERAVRGDHQQWADYSDEQVLVLWGDLLSHILLDTLEVAAAEDPDRADEMDFGDHGIALAVMMFLARVQGIPASHASEVIREVAIEEFDDDEAAELWDGWTSAHGHPLALLLARLTDLGAVHVTEHPEEGEIIWLTPLGLHSVREQLIDAGVAVPLFTGSRSLTAAELLALAEGVPEAEYAAATAQWLSRREADDAARELLTAGSEASPVHRMIAVGLAMDLGDAAAGAWSDSLADSHLCGYAKGALAKLAGEEFPDLSLADIAWLATDALSVELDAESAPADIAGCLGQAVPSGREEELFEAMARLPHDNVAGLLTVIGAGHPDKQTAKLARKAAYKASSRRSAIST